MIHHTHIRFWRRADVATTMAIEAALGTKELSRVFVKSLTVVACGLK